MHDVDPEPAAGSAHPEERLAEQYHDQPARLMDLAAATGNRTLYWIARDLLRMRRRKAKRPR